MLAFLAPALGWRIEAKTPRSSCQRTWGALHGHRGAVDSAYWCLSLRWGKEMLWKRPEMFDSTHRCVALTLTLSLSYLGRTGPSNWDTSYGSGSYMPFKFLKKCLFRLRAANRAVVGEDWEDAKRRLLWIASQSPRKGSFKDIMMYLLFIEWSQCK